MNKHEIILDLLNKVLILKDRGINVNFNFCGAVNAVDIFEPTNINLENYFYLDTEIETEAGVKKANEFLDNLMEGKND